tara:strand:+ start:389 stop:823 length:435 start_codon:yes stop_codon:yes gene_type:complete
MTQEFKITAGRGFYMEFASGWAISVQIGDGNYHSRRYEQPGFEIISIGDQHVHVGDYLSAAKGSTDAEIAVWNAVTKREFEEESPGSRFDCAGWVDLSGDVVAGWVRPEAIAFVMAKLAQYPTDACQEMVGEELRGIIHKDKGE